MKRFIVLALFVCATVSAQIMPGIIDSQRNLPGWLSDPNFVAPIFNGVDSYAMQTTPPGSITIPLTMLFWIRPEATTNTYAYLYESGNQRIIISLASGKLQIQCGDGSNHLTQAVSDLPIGKWTHCAYTAPGGTGNSKLYLNGVFDTVGNATASLAVGGTGKLVLGGNNTPSLFSNVRFSEFSFWNRVLSSAEITYYWSKRLSGKEPGLIILYHMNEGVNVASQAFIDSVSGKNMSLYSSVQWSLRRGYTAPDIRSSRYCVQLDGINDYIQLASPSVAGLDGATFCAWIQELSAATSYAYPLYEADDASDVTTYKFGIFSNTGSTNLNGQFRRYGVVATKTSYISSVYPQWHHWALTYASTAASLLLYRDGNLVGNATGTPGTLLSPTSGCYMGISGNVTPLYTLKFKIAEHGRFSRALSRAEIQTLMYSRPATTTNLLCWFSFNNSTGTVISDDYGLATATLVNGPVWVGRDIP